MKPPLFFAAVFLMYFACSMDAISQSTDLAITRVHLSADSNIVPPGITSSMAVTIVNQDSVAVPTGDTLHLAININGSSYNNILVLNAALEPAGTLYQSFGPDALFTFHDTITSAQASGSVFHPADTNPTNDTHTVNFLVSIFASNDWSATVFEIQSPDFLDSFDLDNNTNFPPPVDLATLTLFNSGDVTYLQYTPIQYALVLGADTTTITAVLADGDVAPNQSSQRTISNQVVFPSLPDSVGTYQMCAYSLAASDINFTNDTSCYAFTFVDNYDPTDPANWPFGVDEAKPAPFKVIGVNNGFQMIDIIENLRINVYNTQGSLVLNGVEATTNNQYSLPSSGLYIIELIAADGQVWRVKQLNF